MYIALIATGKVMGIVAFLLVVKQPGHEAVHPPSSNAKDDNGKT
jgi:hypothetical protein